MAWWFSFRQRVRAILRRREMELEMEEELQFHLDQAIDRNMVRGMDRAEARRTALKDFGGVERRKEQMRDERGMRPLIDFSPNYFKTMGIPLLSGETFSQTGLGVQSSEIIVSEELAKQFWRDQYVIGQSLLVEIDGKERMVEVRGVVGNTKVAEFREEPESFLYLPFGERYTKTSILVARTAGSPNGLPDLFRRELGSLDDSVPLFDTRTMSEHLDVTVFLHRTAALYLSVFGLLAMVLASIGLYGTVAFSVTLRTKEVGIRMALGADRRQVVRMVLQQSLRLVIAGIVIGLVLSSLIMQALSRVLMGVSPIDPVAFVSVVIVLGSVTILASFLPALKAAGMDPMSTLRYE